MKRIFLFLLLTLLGALLAGCGGGSGNRGVKARGVGQVKLTIALPPDIQKKLAKAYTGSSASGSRTAPRVPATSKAAAAATTGNRVIPNNSAQVTVTYNVFGGNPDINGVAPAIVQQPVAPGATSISIELPDVVAGVPNIISVAITDVNGATIADGSTTVNIAPGSSAATNAVNITLVSTVTGAVTYSFDGGLLPPGLTDVRPHNLRVLGILNTDGTPVTTIAAASLTWTSLSPNISVTKNPDGSATIQQLSHSNNAADTFGIRLDYAEPENGNSHLVLSNTLNFTLSAALTSQATQVITQSGGLTNVPPANVYDVTDNGYALYYDALRTTSVDANAGYSRIVQFALPSPFTLNSLVDFDTAATPTYVSAASRTAFFTEGGANYWATIGSGNAVDALQSGQYRGVGSPRWIIAPTATYLDVDVKGGQAHLLGSAGIYLIETFPQSSTGLIIAGFNAQTVSLTGIGFNPTNLAVVSGGGGVFDYYLADATHIAKVHVVGGSVASVIPNFATFANIADIASTATDTRFLYVLTTTDVRVLSTQDGSQVALSGLAAGGTGRRLSAAEAGSGSNVYALEDNGATSSQIQGFTFQ